MMNLTLFVPLCGRRDIFVGPFSTFLREQYWEHSAIRLVFCDTSGDETFGEILKHWLKTSDYPHNEYLKLECKRPTNGIELNNLCCDIYNVATNYADTQYIWIVEDDVIPPLNAGIRLVSHFTEFTGSCSGVYRHKYENDRFLVWNHKKRYRILKEGEGVHLIQGNGFGCVVMRGSLLNGYVFKHVDAMPPCYDHTFWDQVEMQKWVDWSVRCDHLGPSLWY